jgi:hypothetical protein
VNDPNGFIQAEASRIAQQMFEERLGPVAYRLQEIDRKTDAYQHVSATNMINQTKGVVDQGYRSVIGKDSAYRENETVRNYVDGEMKRMLEEASSRAYRGDPSMLQMFHNPAFPRAFLAAAKETVGYQPRPVATAVPSGATVEGAAPPQQQAVVELPQDLELIANKMSARDAERLRKSYAETKKRGDFELE